MTLDFQQLSTPINKKFRLIISLMFSKLVDEKENRQPRNISSFYLRTGREDRQENARGNHLLRGYVTREDGNSRAFVTSSTRLHSCIGVNHDNFDIDSWSSKTLHQEKVFFMENLANIYQLSTQTLWLVTHSLLRGITWRSQRRSA